MIRTSFDTFCEFRYVFDDAVCADMMLLMVMATARWLSGWGWVVYQYSVWPNLLVRCPTGPIASCSIGNISLTVSALSRLWNTNKWTDFASVALFAYYQSARIVFGASIDFC